MENWPHSAAIAGIPSVVVTALVAALYLVIGTIAYQPRTWHAAGEIQGAENGSWNWHNISNIFEIVRTMYGFVVESELYSCEEYVQYLYSPFTRDGTNARLDGGIPPRGHGV